MYAKYKKVRLELMSSYSFILPYWIGHNGHATIFKPNEIHIMLALLNVIYARYVYE